MDMYLSQAALKKIFLGLITLAVLLGLFAVYFYFPTIVNKLGLNKVPSKEVQQLLTGYNTTQTAEDYLELDKKVAKMAVSSPSLDITNCTPYPRIVRIGFDTTLKITNSDSQKHVLTMNGKEIAVKAKGVREVIVDFVGSTPIPLPYNCDDLNEFSGILYIIKK